MFQLSRHETKMRLSRLKAHLQDLRAEIDYILANTNEDLDLSIIRDLIDMTRVTLNRTIWDHESEE